MTRLPKPLTWPVRLWNGLTAREKKAFLLVTSLLAFGLAVKLWHSSISP